MSYTREQLDEIKKQVGIRPYEKRLTLQQVGAEYRGYCPWHEKDGMHTPSLAVYKDKKVAGAWSFKCMTKCAKMQGDVFAFIQFFDQVIFSEAVRRAADDGGVTNIDASPTALQKPTAEQFEQAKEYLISNGVPLEFAHKYTNGKIHCTIHPKLGLAISYPYDCDPEVIKYRAVFPKNKDSKFSHASGHPSDTLLYNIRHAEREIEDTSAFGAEVMIVESERDCLLVEAQGLGIACVSVSSASTCHKNGQLKICDEHLAILAKAEIIYTGLDQDPAGQECADVFEQSDAFSENQVKRIVWPFAGKRSGDPKDIGDLYLKDPGGFHDRLLTLMEEARQRPPRWRQQFRSAGELDGNPIIQIVEGFLPEGNVGIGGLSGHGKSFVALSLAKALTTGQPFVGRFNVPVIRPVLYLVPEVGDRQLSRRVREFGIPDDEDLFLCRTLSQGPTLPLDHPHVLRAIRNMGNPVVFLDTAIRFSKAKDENSAAENTWLEKAVRGLREVGAIAVVPLHHSPKSAAKEYPSLENTFRGTGDFGALLDIAYCVRNQRKCQDGDPNIELYGERITITNVKPRDFDPPPPFELGLRPAGRDPETGKLRSFIKETGDLAWMAPETEAPPNGKVITVTPVKESLEERLEKTIRENPTATVDRISEILGESKSITHKLANKLGWEKRKNEPWRKTGQKALPVAGQVGDDDAEELACSIEFGVDRETKARIDEIAASAGYKRVDGVWKKLVQ